MSIAISYPFSLDAKGILTTTDFAPKVYLDRLLTLLSTNIGQRPMMQTYGVDLKTALFENEYIHNGGEVTTFKTAVDQAIRTAVARWLPDLQIDTIDISNPDDYGQANISIVVTVPGDVQATLDLTSAVFGSDGTVTRT